MFVDASGALLAGAVDDTLPDVDWEMEGDDAPGLSMAAPRGAPSRRASSRSGGPLGGKSRSSGSMSAPKVDTGRPSKLSHSENAEPEPGAAAEDPTRAPAPMQRFGSGMGQSITGIVGTADGVASLDGIGLASGSQSSPALVGIGGDLTLPGPDDRKTSGEPADAKARHSSPMLITGAASRSAAARVVGGARHAHHRRGSRAEGADQDDDDDDDDDDDETTSEDDSEQGDERDGEWATEERQQRDLVGVSKDEEAAAQALGDRDPRASTVFNLDDIMEDGAGASADEDEDRDPRLDSSATKTGSRLDAPFVSGISGSQTTRSDAASPRITDSASSRTTVGGAAPSARWTTSGGKAKDSKAAAGAGHQAAAAESGSGMGSSLRLSTSSNPGGQRRSGGEVSASLASRLGDGDPIAGRQEGAPALPRLAMMRSGSVHARPQLDAVPESRPRPAAAQQLGEVRSMSAKAVFRDAPDEVAEAALRGYMQARAKNVLAVAFGQGWTDDGDPVLYDNSDLLRQFAAETDEDVDAAAAGRQPPST